MAQIYIVRNDCVSLYISGNEPGDGELGGGHGRPTARVLFDAFLNFSEGGGEDYVEPRGSREKMPTTSYFSQGKIV